MSSPKSTAALLERFERVIHCQPGLWRNIRPAHEISLYCHTCFAWLRICRSALSAALFGVWK